MKKLFVLTSTLLAFCLTGCTYNVSMAHTEGMATDTIDDTASNTPNIAPTVTVPLTPGSSVQVGK
jgi:hypothetical protein